MRDPDGGRCCLCVAQDLASKDIPELKGLDGGYPTNECAKYFGWCHPDPVLADHLANHLNDGYYKLKPQTHKEIATIIREEYAPHNLKEEL